MFNLAISLNGNPVLVYPFEIACLLPTRLRRNDEY